MVNEADGFLSIYSGNLDFLEDLRKRIPFGPFNYGENAHIDALGKKRTN